MLSPVTANYFNREPTVKNLFSARKTKISQYFIYPRLDQCLKGTGVN